MFQNIVKTLRQARRLAVAVIGTTVLLIGIVMIVLPGPSILVIPLGLGILATEFLWARRLLEKCKNILKKQQRSEVKER
ncbi:MAG: PGPGW domain-containing protein [Bacteroidota bacterium]